MLQPRRLDEVKMRAELVLTGEGHDLVADKLKQLVIEHRNTPRCSGF